MISLFAGVLAILSLYIYWSLSPSWRGNYFLAVSLVFGLLLWPTAVVIAVCLTAVQVLLSEKLPKGLMILVLLLPLIAQKLLSVSEVGVSYVSFLALGLYLDNLKSKSKTSFLQGIGFTAFFPIVPVGPIERIENMKAQMTEPRIFDRGIFISGFLLIAVGLFKKIVVADRLSELAVDSEKVFLFYSSVKMWAFFLLSLLQIYFDFSAVIDIVRGISRLFGFEVMDNFDRPYLASTVQGIWQRWHISLVSWLRDVVYNPIALKTRSVTAASGAVLVLVGLWHGLKWQMVAWALYWLSLFWWSVLLRRKGIRLQLPIWIRRLLCVLIMAFSTAFMIPGSLNELVQILGRAFFLSTPNAVETAALLVSETDLIVALAGFGIVLIFEAYMDQLAVRYSRKMKNVSLKTQYISMALIIFFVFLTVAFGVSRWEKFVYMRY